MTTAYDEVLVRAEQLPLAEQARLIAQLASGIQQELEARAGRQGDKETKKQK